MPYTPAPDRYELKCRDNYGNEFEIYGNTPQGVINMAKKNG